MPDPIRICTAEEIRAIDHRAGTEFGLSTEILMENAGVAAVEVLLECYPQAGIDSEVLVFAGKGNNAGDAFVLARRLISLDRRVRVFTLAPESAYSGASLKNYQVLKAIKAKMAQVERVGDLATFFQSSSGPFVAVDGIFGTGLKGNLEGLFFDVVELLNHSVPEIFSLDIPSGVDSDTGAIRGTSIMASATVSFGFPKLGHFLPPGAGRRGVLTHVDISLPPQFRKEGSQFLLTRGPLNAMLSKRDRYGHKNSFGHTLLIGGSPGRLGAIVMAARACHRIGTGLVTVATWEDCLPTLMAKLPDETMALPLRLSERDLESYKNDGLAAYSSVVVGPGLGMRPEGKRMLQELLQHYPGPVVLDADALNLVADHGLHDHLVSRPGPTVLTPHVGEMARLMGASKESILDNPVASLRDAVKRTHAVTLLKGAATLIASPTEDTLYLNHYPNDGMATAGSGDVLAGMIGGLVGQKFDVFHATQLAVYLHSLAGDFAARAHGHRSMTAPDIIENIGNAFKEIRKAPPESEVRSGRIRLL